MIRMQVRRLLLTFSIVSLLTSGCSSSQGPQGKISGSVTLDGTPLTTGQVSFFSTALATGSTAPIEPDGTFQFATPLPEGEYAITLVGPMEEPGGPAPPPFKVPPRYLQPDKSGLTCSVKPGENSCNLELTSR